VKNKLPQHPGELEKLISKEYEGMSKRLKQVAGFVLENPNAIALETMVKIGQQAGVPPSTLIRFARALGYSGFREIQQIFRVALAVKTPSYRDRVRLLEKNYGQDENQSFSPGKVLNESVRSNNLALEHMAENILNKTIEKAVKLLLEAEAVYIIGMRRAFPIASYLVYALRKLERRAFVLDGSGGTINDEISVIGKKDVLVAISFAPYAEESLNAVNWASSQKAGVIGISDSPLSPFASKSSVYFEVKNSEVRGFRSLAAPLCLAQSIIVSLAYFQESSGSKTKGGRLPKHQKKIRSVK